MENIPLLYFSWKVFIKKNEKEAILIFLDAEKVFDNVPWVFMKRIMEIMDFGIAFIKGIEGYMEQRVKMLINGTMTERCRIVLKIFSICFHCFVALSLVVCYPELLWLYKSIKQTRKPLFQFI